MPQICLMTVIFAAITLVMSIAPAILSALQNPATRRGFLKALFEPKGLSFRSFAFRIGVSHQAVCQSAAGHGSSHIREAIAHEIGLTPQQLYPERYDAAGNHLGRIRDQQRSTRSHLCNVEDERAA